MLQIETTKSSNNELNSLISGEKLPSQTTNTQTEKLLIPQTEQSDTTQQQQPDLSIKHKPSEVVENALKKYLKLKATTFNLDKIIEVNSSSQVFKKQL